MSRGPDALVTPELLRWAREEAGYSVGDAARKASVPREALESWERGLARPSIPQARKLADVYRRPLAAFYLPFPPQPAPAPHDFRHQRGETGTSPTVQREIRRARWRREIALDLYNELGEAPRKWDARASLSEDPETVGARVRELLFAAATSQTDHADDYSALRAWRNALEAQGVLVFQIPDVPLDEMLGFSLSEHLLPVISANVKSHPRARIFTLMHEFAHLLLRRGGVCDLGEDGPPQSESTRVEVFCNRVAGAALVPLALLHHDFASRDIDLETVTTLARRYHVGREVIARRMLIGGWINSQLFQTWRLRFQQDFTPREG